MELDKFSRRSKDSDGVVYRNISLFASRGELWPRVRTGKSFDSDLTKILPVTKLTSEFKKGLQRLINDPNYSMDIDRYIRAVEIPTGAFLQDIKCFSKCEKGEHMVKLVNSQAVGVSVYEKILKGVMKKIDTYTENSHLTTNDLCTQYVQCYSKNHSYILKFSLFFPDVTLKFQPLAPLKLVSTSLCISLTRKDIPTTNFQSGYLTLDQKRRVLPLLINDAQIFKYPLIGVWVSGNEKEIWNSQLVWAACVRFIESQSVHERISPDPDKNDFLLVHFSPKPVFYEVSTRGKAVWKIVTKQLLKNSSEISFLGKKEEGFVQRSPGKKSLTASTSPSSGRYSQNRASFETDSTENMILKQNLMLKTLEKQITELQHALSEPKLVHAETNTTNYFNQTQPIISVRVPNRQNTAVHMSTEFVSKNNPLRNSCNIELKSRISDVTITVPKIIYKSDSESCDEEIPYELKNIS